HVAPLAEISLFNSKEWAIVLERVLQTLHVIRNLTFDPMNAAAFSESHALKIALAKGIALPAHTHYVEVRQHALDIFENLAPYHALHSSADFFLAVLLRALFSPDRAAIVAGARTLARLCASEPNARIMADLDPAVVERLLQLLLVPDEDLVIAVLELFYELSSLTPEVGVRIAGCAPYNVLKLFTKFLHWRGFGGATPSPYVYGHGGPGGGGPPPGLTLNMALPMAGAAPPSALSTSPSLPYPMGMPVVSPVTTNPPSPLPAVPIQCWWGRLSSSSVSTTPATQAEPQDPDAPCSQTFETPAQLSRHVATCHLPPASQPSSDDAPLPASPSPPRSYSCRWRGCTALPSTPSRARALAHFATHAPLQPASELRGVPLTTLLVLRNLAKHPDNRSLFGPYEANLANMMITHPKFAKMIAQVLAELRG
ncbi:hypothetical protein BDK51DRAFT_19537, partial [Blyttiomyces helicus]